MQKLKIVAFAVLATMCGHIFSQDQEWEPQKQITGYVAVEGERFFGLKGYDREWGMTLSEAGLLFSYQPTSSITLKSVVVYHPTFNLDQCLNEASAEWKGADFFKVKVGRFLTPLSPMNTYYYAPVNNSVTLPMIISHHEIFPVNMDAVSVNGNIGDDFKVGYNVFSGGYRSSLWMKTGSTGFFGTEVDYFNSIKVPQYIVDAEKYNTALSFATGAHVDFSYQDIITVGLNVFNGVDDKIDVQILAVAGNDTMRNPATGQFVYMPNTLDLQKFAYGTNLKFKLNNFQLLGEYWQNDMVFSKDMSGIRIFEQKVDVKGAFAEASYNINKLTPYARYEYHDANIEYERYTVGLNYKPIFEATFKLEYMIYTQASNDLQGIIGSVIYSF